MLSWINADSRNNSLYTSDEVGISIIWSQNLHHIINISSKLWSVAIFQINLHETKDEQYRGEWLRNLNWNSFEMEDGDGAPEISRSNSVTPLTAHFKTAGVFFSGEPEKHRGRWLTLCKINNPILKHNKFSEGIANRRRWLTLKVDDGLIDIWQATPAIFYLPQWVQLSSPAILNDSTAFFY